MGAWLSMWSERAGLAEYNAALLADVLERILHDPVAYLPGPLERDLREALIAHRTADMRLRRALPTGPTLIGT